MGESALILSYNVCTTKIYFKINKVSGFKDVFMTMIHIWISIFIFLSIYPFIIYPLILKLLSILTTKTIAKGNYTPSISIIICAYNEERNIRKKIENTLQLKYQDDKCQILIVSDGSTDNTDKIIQEYKRIQYLRAPSRGGKEKALRYAITYTTGEIIVFSDVATRIDPDAILKLTQNFNDPKIGVVSSTDKFITETGQPAGEGLYVKYEMLLRSLETKVNGLIGVSGSFFATRKVLCNDWPENVASDFNIVLNGIKSGYRAVSDPDVAGYYADLKGSHGEFKRKVRTLITGFAGFFGKLELLNFFKYGLYSWQIISHKLFRWLDPVFLLLLLLTSFAGMIMQDMISAILFGSQLLFYFCAALGFLSPKLHKILFIKIPFYFMEVNVAIIVAWMKYASGHRVSMWQPSERAEHS
jgi:glycosyltransferase involved in cell wall biosynthesis